MGKLKKIIGTITLPTNNYTLNDIELLISKIINDSNSKYDEKKILKTLLKYVTINNNTISIDLSKKNLTMTFDKLRRTIILNNLMAIKYPEQRSSEWFKLREKTDITGSDVGAILGLNIYEKFYNVIRKKIYGSTFTTNDACYHGTKYEKIASIIYENTNNVKLADFGLVVHSEHSFIGASPDAICQDTDLVGRMVEIKCPFKRYIKSKGVVKGNICPIYYWAQVQLQLECCNLDECDFWQCTFKEYNSKEEFINDTQAVEKGCLIQILPLECAVLITSNPDIVFEKAKFIYPPNELLKSKSINDWDTYIANIVYSIKKDYPTYYLDKIIYWKLLNSNCSLIERDKSWFSESFPKLKEISEFIGFLKKNKDIADEYFKYIDDNKIITDEQAFDKLYQICTPNKETIN
jgi:putative phage-type endonuclease